MNTPNSRRIQELRNMPYVEYLQTPEWAQKRDETLERDEHRCRACNTGENLHVHHRTYARRGNEEIGDLTTLCSSCHEHFHKRISQAEIMGRTYSKVTTEEERASKNARNAQKWEDYLIGLLLQNPKLLHHVNGMLPEDDFTGEDTRELYRVIKATYQCKATPAPQPLEQFVPSELLSTANRAAEMITSDTVINSKGMDESRQVKEAMQCVARLKRVGQLRLHEELQTCVREAALSGNKELEKQLREQMLVNKKALNVLYTSAQLS